MRKLRVLVMMDEALVPPASVAGMSAGEIAPFKTELDVTTALCELGHDVEVVGVKTDLDVLSDAIRRTRPHVCFNLVEDFNGIPSRLAISMALSKPFSGDVLPKNARYFPGLM